jgi:multisubunit Na+/H+ antiporter MnhB subunit
MIDAITSITMGNNQMNWILGAIAVALAISFYKAQKANNFFDLKEMFTDPDTKLTSLTRFGTFVALVVSSWGFVYLVTSNSLTEMYFTIYMSIWTGTNLISKGIAAMSKKSEQKKEE